jgi:hypothetical protein
VLLGHPEQRLAVIEALGGENPAQKGMQAVLAVFQTLFPQILAVERQEVEDPHVQLGRFR